MQQRLPFSESEVQRMVDTVAEEMDGLQFLVFRGSVAHETFVPSSDPNSIDDVDLMGMVVPGIEHYLGLATWGSRGTRELMCDELDVVAYELRKLMRLLYKANPNVLALLFLDEEYIILDSEPYRMLRESRDLFLSKHVYTTFVGYANGQLKAMTNFSFEGYMGEKRKRLVEEYGYDAKNAGHLIRLLRMGRDLLRTGQFQVHRGEIDAEELIAIKQGGWSLERVKAEADRLFAECEEALEASSLPDRADEDAISDLCVRIVARALDLKL